jgi:uncharacterized protein YkwD
MSDALAHADWMAQHQIMEDDPALGSDVCCWTMVAENSGVGPSVSALDAAFMASAPHRANILNAAYTQIGVGVVVADGRVWVAEIFRRPA